MSEEEIILHLKEIKHTMECEGLPLTKQNEQDILDILRGEKTEEEVRERILKRNGLLEKKGQVEKCRNH